jgi:NAD(P)-dependent dehydrogenase (short-subunit alcohol dehydrogenase family)
MTPLQGKTAVITGAGSGLGRAMALAFADEGMHLALADVDKRGLQETLQLLKSRNIKASAARVDVSKGREVEAFAASLKEVHLVCNNAGVALGGAVWEYSEDDWRWILGVNLWGVIHGLRAFTPRLIAQGEGHIVNTASVSGLISAPSAGAYGVTKHAVVTLSESLHHDLREHGSPVGVSLLCPAYVPTGISESERNRPADSRKGPRSARTLAHQANLKQAVAKGRVSADEVARMVVSAVKENRFYVLTHAKIKLAVQARMQDIVEERVPRSPLDLKQQ